MTITRQHLERTALPYDKCESILLDALHGEGILREDPQADDKLQAALGLKKTFASRAVIPSPQDKWAKRQLKRARKPGEPNPKRRPIGLPPEGGKA